MTTIFLLQEMTWKTEESGVCAERAQKIQERESLIAGEVLRVHVRACQRFTFYTENYAHLSISYFSLRMLFIPLMFI